MTADSERRETPEPIEDEVVIDGEAGPPEPIKEPRKRGRFDNLDPEDADYSERVKRRLSQVTRQRREAEARAQAATERAEQAERVALELRRNHLTTADSTLEREMKGAQSRASRAISEGDADAAAEATAEMARFAAQREQVRRDVETTPRQLQPSQAPRRFTEKTQAFLDDRPWALTDPAANRSLATVHEAAQARGLVADTPEYFAFADRTLRTLFPERYEDEEDEPEPDRPARRASAAPVAPARRTAPGAPAGTTQIRLTKEEGELCERNGWDVKAYAKAKVARAAEEGVRK